MLFGPTQQPCDSSGSKSAPTTMTPFHWLILLGFPVDVAAAKAMPELFSDSAPVRYVTDGVRVFLRDELAA
jgi:hypothetical protein